MQFTLKESRTIQNFKQSLDLKSYSLFTSLLIELSIRSANSSMKIEVHQENFKKIIQQFNELLQQIEQLSGLLKGPLKQRNFKFYIKNGQYKNLQQYILRINHQGINDQLNDFGYYWTSSVQELIVQLRKHYEMQVLLQTPWRQKVEQKRQFHSRLQNLLNYTIQNEYPLDEQGQIGLIINQIEELYILYDAHNIGFLTEDQLLFLYCALIKSEVINTQEFNKETFIDFLKSLEIFHGKVFYYFYKKQFTLRAFKRFFFKNQLISKSLLMNLQVQTIAIINLYPQLQKQSKLPNIRFNAINDILELNKQSSYNANNQSFKTFSTILKQLLIEYSLSLLYEDQIQQQIYELVDIYLQEFQDSNIELLLNITNNDIIKFLFDYFQQYNYLIEQTIIELTHKMFYLSEKNKVISEKDKNKERVIEKEIFSQRENDKIPKVQPIVQQKLTKIEETDEDSQLGQNQNKNTVPKIKFKFPSNNEDFVVLNIQKAKEKIIAQQEQKTQRKTSRKEVKTQRVQIDPQIIEQFQDAQEKQNQSEIVSTEPVPVLNINLHNLKKIPQEQVDVEEQKQQEQFLGTFQPSTDFEIKQTKTNSKSFEKVMAQLENYEKKKKIMPKKKQFL